MDDADRAQEITNLEIKHRLQQRKPELPEVSVGHWCSDEVEIGHFCDADC